MVTVKETVCPVCLSVGNPLDLTYGADVTAAALSNSNDLDTGSLPSHTEFAGNAIVKVPRSLFGILIASLQIRFAVNISKLPAQAPPTIKSVFVNPVASFASVKISIQAVASPNGCVKAVISVSASLA